TKCVDVYQGTSIPNTGTPFAHQQSNTVKSTWTFQFIAGTGDGVQFMTAAAYPNFNNNNICNQQSQNPATASYTLDNTGPSVTGSVAPTPNGAGWNKSDMTIAWSATDAGSGVASGPTPATDSQTANTSGVTKTSTATDRLGNTGSGSVTIKLDKNAPTVTGSASPAANANGWNNSDVTMSWTCTDTGGSGITGSCPGPQVLSTNGANQSVTSGTVSDLAGNTASGIVSGISIDKVAPTLSGAPTTSPNAANWYNGNVTIHWTGSDSLSGIDPATAPADSV